jgi:ribosomal protein S18 acetylase RimI-like enzyme
MGEDILFKSGDITVLDDVRELWEELNQYHLVKSPYFKYHFANFTFQARKESLIESAEKGKLFTLIAYHESEKVGYCIASVVNDIGEVDSIYVKPEYRETGIGNTLMEKSLDWINSSYAKNIIIKVAVGNEEAFGFYSKYGFAPRYVELQLVPK